MSAEKQSFSVWEFPDSTKNGFAEASSSALLRSVSTPEPPGVLAGLDNNFKRARRGGLHGSGSVSLGVLQRHLDDWIFDAQFRGQSPCTSEGKCDALRRFLWWLEREAIADCTRTACKRYFHYVANSHNEPLGRWDNASNARNFLPVSERTIQLYFTYVKGYFDFLAEEELIEESPLAGVKQPQAPTREVHPFTEDEILALLAAAGRGPEARRDTALVFCLLDTGARVSEIAGLALEDLNVETGVATITGKGNKERQIFFELETARMLRLYLKSSPCRPDQPIFRSTNNRNRGQGLTRMAIGRIIRRLGAAAGISEKRCSPHTLRHTFASRMANSGCPPKALMHMLGHTNLEMTMHYIHLAEGDAREQHRKHSPTRGLWKKSK